MAGDPRVTRLGALGIRGPRATQILWRSNRAIPVGWLQMYLEVHFTKRGARRYRYTPRDGERGSGRKFEGSYTQTKLKRHSHTRPLVYSGRGEAAAKANSYARATRKTATAVIPARVFNWKNPKSRVDMNRELTTVLQMENDRLDELASLKAEAEFRRASKGR